MKFILLTLALLFTVNVSAMNATKILRKAIVPDVAQDGETLVFNGDLQKWEFGAGGESAIDTENYRAKTIFSDDFFHFPPTSFTAGIPSASTVSGAGAQVTLQGNNDARVGVLALQSGTDTSGRAAVFTGLSWYVNGGTLIWNTGIKVTTLSDGTETYSFRTGYGTTTSTVAQGQAIQFLYDSAQSANWICVTDKDGTDTKTVSSIPVTAAEHNLKIVATSASVLFYVDDVLACTNTTNIPAAADESLHGQMVVQKSAGTTNRLVEIDWYAMQKNYTTNRK